MYNIESKLQPHLGSTIQQTVSEAIHTARLTDGRVMFEFNGITVTVVKDSNPVLIVRDYRRAIHGYTPTKNVGPYPNDPLTKEEQERDKQIEAEQAEQRARQRAEYAQWRAEKSAALTARLTHPAAREIELADEPEWTRIKATNMNAGGYSRATLEYAETWARLMQIGIAEAGGKLDEANVKATSDEADIEGITGFMHAYARNTLLRVWKYRDQLRLLTGGE
jgi:hypothetical protein